MCPSDPSDSVFQVVSDCGISRVLQRVLQVGEISGDKQPAGWNYDKYLLQHHQAALYQHTLDRIEQDKITPFKINKSF